MATEKKLKVGDKVMWRGSWGNEPAKLATVTGMEICSNGSKSGRSVGSADWDVVTSGRKVVVELDNGHWAYGEQLRPR
jgi:hypothetical protein